MPGVAGQATESERRFLVLRKPGALLSGAAEGDRYRLGEERAEVPVGGA